MAASGQPYNISTLVGGVPRAVAAASNAATGQPQRVAVDSSGNLYFTSLHCVYRMRPGGALTLVAGNGRAGFGGDGGPAAQAQLNTPRGLALDGSGNLYVADSGNHRIRKVAPDGTITTVAGSTIAGYYGDGGAAIAGLLRLPSGVAVDGSGNLYIADTGNHVIREVTPDGTISTLTGIGGAGFAGDTGPPSGGVIANPEDVAVDGSGNLYIADTGNLCVRKIASDVISTVAGRGTDTSDGVQATTAALNGPFALAVDSAGNFYVAEWGSSRIRKVDTKGVITTVAGTGTAGFGGDGGPAAKAQLSTPAGLALDSAGNLYIADFGNNRIRQVSSSGNIATVAGNGNFWYSGDGGAATSAQLNGPTGIAVDAGGNVYFADTLNHRVRKMSPDGTITTVAGTGTGGFGGDGGAAGAAQLNQPFGLALAAAGNLYIADMQNHRVRQVRPAGSITTAAGSATPGFGGDGGAPSSAQLNYPTGVAVDTAGNLYIAEHGNQRVRVVSNGVITTLAGNGLGTYAGDGGAAAQASLNGPTGVAVDGSGNVFIADTGNNVIRMVSPDRYIITVAGTGVLGYSGEGGPAASAQLVAPTAVVRDASGNLYITADSRILIAPVGGSIATIAGNGKPGYTGDGGPATDALVNAPRGLAVDAFGNVYVADTLNNAIRLLQPAATPGP